MSDFNPSEHKVDEVIEYLASADEDEQIRVLEAEAEGQDRATIRDWTPDADPDADPDVDPDEEGEEPETATESTPDDTDEYDFEQTEDNAILLLAAAAELGLDPSVVTTKGGRLQAPAAVVAAAGDALDTDKD